MFLQQDLRKGEVWMFEGMFAHLAGRRTNLVRRLVYEPSGEGVAIACETAELTKPDFGSLFLLSRAARAGDKTVEPDEVARSLDFRSVTPGYRKIFGQPVEAGSRLSVCHSTD